MAGSGLTLETLFSAGAMGAVPDPYPFYRELRDDSPAISIPNPIGALDDGSTPAFAMLTRYDDVRAALKDAELFSSAVVNRTMANLLGPTIIGMDGREHLKHRALVTPSLAPRALRGDFPAFVERIAHEQIDRFAARGEADLREAFTFGYPLRVFVEILGLSPEDVDRFHAWSIDLTHAATDLAGGLEAARRMQECLAPIIERKRAAGGDDLIAALARAEVDGEGLTDLEVVSFLRLLVSAGAETTYHLLGSCLVALLRDPALLGRVRADRSLIAPFLQEILRWESPVAMLMRETTRDVELHGVLLQKGTQVTLNIASANRDERRFHDPDRVDVDRADKEHVSFGFGKHYCAGSRLALLEAEVGLNALLDRLPGLEARPGEDFAVIGVTFRGPDRLPVRFDPTRSSAATP